MPTFDFQIDQIQSSAVLIMRPVFSTDSANYQGLEITTDTRLPASYFLELAVLGTD